MIVVLFLLGQVIRYRLNRKMSIAGVWKTTHILRKIVYVLAPTATVAGCILYFNHFRNEWIDSAVLNSTVAIIALTMLIFFAAEGRSKHSID